MGPPSTPSRPLSAVVGRAASLPPRRPLVCIPMTVVLRATMDQSLVALQRQLRALAPDIQLLTDGEQPLERTTHDARPPRLVGAEVIEGAGMRMRRVFGDPVVAFAAFLDGTQTSHVVA